MEENHLCTGSLISKNHVLTAATCLADVSATDLKVIFGSKDENSPYHSAFTVSFKITYEDWCNNQPWCFFEKFTDDVSILELDVIDPGISKVSITPYAFQPGDKITATGWGRSPQLLHPNTPRTGFMTIMEKNACEARVRRLIHTSLRDVILPPKLSCAVAEPEVLVTKGDFGGPVRLKRGRKVSGILIQRSPMYHPASFHSEQVNLVLNLDTFQDFINDVVGANTVGPNKRREMD
ncbi:hypothetical protein QAD02_004305 [Eretmocerus hayati]|uniref:Uncharacterized protein n=1 Tax=Eretmocerus hayati TaxID=131215 RepID=A0ACC2NP69_9HYME|nr:hypothetical protein QAD02_004305 [Eretmocerus hayati]